jgi:exo-beta-1,3-glucanase (GH17 family)
MKHRTGFRFLSGILLIAFIQGCAAPASSPTSSLAFTPTIIQTSIPTLPATVTPVPRELIHGLAYSPYRDCQSADTPDQPTLDDVKQDLQIIGSMANGIRTYSSTGISAEIPAIARQMGLRVSAGAWLGKDKAANEREIQGVIDTAKKVDLDSVIVGNEVLLRGDLSEDELLGYIERVKKAVNVPVTTAEIGNILLAHPRVMAAVDFEMVHLYPFWDGASINGAAQAVIDQYHNIQKKSNGKGVVIGETGWPSAGPANKAAVPSMENQIQFAKEFLTLALSDKVDFYYFDAFDEMWKTEGGIGPYWGLLKSDRTFKSDVRNVMISYNVTPRPNSRGSGISTTPGATPQVTQSGPGSSDFYIYSNFADQQNNFAPGGWMGDLSSIGINTCWTKGQTWPKSIIRVSYAPLETDAKGWSGIYWLQPDGNWGTIPKAGFDLSKYRQLIFRARAENSGTQIKFFVGGVSQTDNPTPTPLLYPSSIKTPIFAQEADPVDGFINLTDSWQEYHVDLTQADLRYVIDGFGWAAERARTPEGAIFYLDDIRFVSVEPSQNVIPPFHVYSSELLRSGLNMGVDSSGHLYNWVQNLKGQMKAGYPAGQQWGVIFITVGNPAARGSRKSMDLSKYRYLSVEMRSEMNDQTVLIGLKDKNQLDNGLETVLPANLSSEWKTYSFELNKFRWADLTQIYIPIEFVFQGNNAAKEPIYFRNIQYLP